MNNKLKESIERLKESKEILKKFSSKEDAVEYLIKETSLSKDECSNAYDFLMKIELEQEFSKTKEETQKKSNTWEIIFLVLCSPIWLSLLVAVFSIFLSIYIVLWVVIICFWATFGSIFGFAIAMILSGIPFAFGNNNLTGLAMISAGMVCIGVSILLFYGCKIATKGNLLLTKKIILWIKNCFSKREVA